MFGTIRKHQQWLWAIIITLTIVSFVIFFSPASKVNNARRAPDARGSINGQRVSNQEFLDAWRDLDLNYFIRSDGHWPNENARKADFDQETEAYQWLLLLQKADQMGIHVSSDTVIQLAKAMLNQFQHGEINSDAFVRLVLNPHGLRLEDFERFVRHLAIIQELSATVSLSGKLVTPQEARELYAREHEELATEAVFFSASNYLATVPAPPEAISLFYTNHLADYRLPDRVQLKYVKFAVSNFQAKAEAEWLKTNLTELIEDNFKRSGTNFMHSKTPEEARAKIREELIRLRALSMATNSAKEFVGPLFSMEPMAAGNLEVMAASNGLTVSLTAPFDERAGPKDLDVGADFIKAAFSRSAEEPFAPPIGGRDGVYVIAFDKKLPSEIPPLETIRERVVGDYKFDQARFLAAKAAQEFYGKLTNGLAQGTAFAALAADAKVKLTELPPFSQSTRELPELEDRLNLEGRGGLKQIAFSTPVGKTSPVYLTSEGAIILHVKSRLPLDEAKMKTDLPAFIAAVRQARENEAFNKWFGTERERGLRDTPLFRQVPAQGAPASGRAKS